MSTPAPALELRNVARSYAEGKGRLEVFRDLNLMVYPGEIVALVGQSGSGKSSLLHIAGLLEAPTSGEVLIAGRNCSELDDMARTRIRRIGVGFVYQFHHLLPEFSAIENVVIPQLIAGAKKPAAKARKSFWSGSDLASVWSIARPNFPAANSNALPSPGPSQTGRCSCWLTSPPEISIRRRRRAFTTSCCG
jgi:ABC-type transporter Mla maintaining outer membrane lipid asymmetry ATPase subunit MlaF